MQEVLNLIGYDIGGTKIGIGIGNSNGEIYAKARIENKDTKPETVLPQMVTTTLDLLNKANLAIKDIKAFGISSPSPADIPNGIMRADRPCRAGRCRERRQLRHAGGVVFRSRPRQP